MKVRYIVILAFGVAIVALAFIHTCSPIIEPAAPRLKLRAAAQIRGLGVMLSTLNDDPIVDSFSNNVSATIELDGEKVYAGLSQKSNNLINFPDTEWSRSHRFADPWGQNYIFLFHRITNANQNIQWTVTIRSIGANAKDEHGAGDDVVGENVKI
jgi:hypothetical protein